MNAVEIEEAISDLVLESFGRDEFPYQFLEVFGNKVTKPIEINTYPVSGDQNR